MLDLGYKRFLKAINQGTLPPWLLKGAWKLWYQILARRWRDDSWTFMNYGWMPPETEPPIPLAPEDEADRCFIGLYHRLSSHIPLAGKTVLEVGSGRGGGSSWLARTQGPARMTGLDFSPKAVALSRRFHQGVPTLTFQTGDAEALPFPDATFDAVLNVESSHCYGDMPRFVSEVARVLKPGGHFGWVDLRGPGMLPATEAAFQHPDLTAVVEEDLTQGVVRALDAAHARKAAVIDQLRVGRALAHQFSATRGTAIYSSLQKGQTRYLCKVLERRR